MWFKGKKIVVLGILSVLLFILVTAANTVITLDPSLPSTITENVNLTLSAEFTNEDGFFSLKNLNQFSDGSESKNLTFKGESQTVYVNLPKSATVTSAMFDMTGYEYSDYVYYSFENENYIHSQSPVVFFGKSGVGMVNPEIYLQNILIDFSANQVELMYHELIYNYDGVEYPPPDYSYSVQVCSTDVDNACNSDYTTLVNSFTITTHPNDVQIIPFDTNYLFEKGINYKINFVPAESQEDGLYQVYAAEGNCLWNDNQPTWDECSPKNLTIYLKLYPEPMGPNNLWFYVGDNEDEAYDVWFYEGDLTDVQTTSSDLTEDFNYYLSTCEEDEEGNCLVPIVFSSETIGVIEVYNINITYLEPNLCQVCIAADGKCDTEWLDTTTEYVGDFSGMCSHYWNTLKYNHSNYEVGFRVEDSHGEKTSALKQILLHKPLELNNYTLDSDLVKIGDFVTVSTNWTWINRTENNVGTRGNHFYDLNNITCSLYADDTLVQVGRSNASSWCNFAYYVNVSDYPSLSLYVKGMDKEGREGITPTMPVKVGVNQTVEAGTPTEVDFTSIADSNITFFFDDDLEVIISVEESENLTSSPSGLNSLKAINIEVDDNTKAGLLWGLIKIFYNESELLAANTPDESTLKVYYYNESAAEWQLEPNQGVNIESNYVWVNVTHFSTYGVFGETPPSPPQSSGNGGGGGGGGGGSSGKPANTTVPASEAPAAVPLQETTVSAPTPVEDKEETEQAVENIVQGEATTETSPSSGITGAVVGLTDTVKERPVAVGVLLVSVAVVGVLVYQSIKRKKNKETTL